MSEFSGQSQGESGSACIPDMLVRALTNLEFPEHRALQPVLTDQSFAALGQWAVDHQKQSARELAELYRAQFGQLDRRFINGLVFTEKVFKEWQEFLLLDEVIKEVLKTWWCGLFAAFLSDQTLATDENHPLRQLLCRIETHSFGWFSGLERSGRRWLEHLEELTAFLQQADVLDPLKQHSQLLATEDFIEKEIKRAQVLEKRVREAEIGTDRSWYYRQLAVQTVNQFLSSSVMPAAVAEFLTGPWLDSMQLLLLEEGEQGASWKRQLKLIDSLIGAFREGEEAADKKRLYEIAAALPRELSKGLLCFKHSPQQAASWLDSIQALLMLRVKGESVETQNYPLLSQESGFRLRTDLSTDQGHALIDKWFLHQKSGTRQKCIAYLPYREQVVWVNYLGVKVGVQSWQEAREELRTQVLQPLSAQSSLSRALENNVARFLKVYGLQEKQRQLAAERKAEEARQEELRRLEAREKAEAEAARIARERAILEKRREAERQAAEERARIEKLEDEERIREQKIQQARDALDGLQLGGWVEINDQGEFKRCKLAVRLNATDKLVFVDRLGLRVGDFRREDLVQMIAEGQARVLESGSDFDERLSRVVGSIRSDRR